MIHHTPGPWRFDGDYVWADSIQCNVADPQTEDMISGEKISRSLAAKQWRANAHLIAAAPEMIEALMDAVAALGGIGSVKVPESVLNAIAKARGEI